MRNFSKKRQQELDQLCNDLAENMNVQHWKRKDLIDCIGYLGDALYYQRQQFNEFQGMISLSSLELANKAMEWKIKR